MRGWHEWVAAVGDLVPGGVPALGMGLLLITVLGSLLWYFWPDWLPGGRRRRGRSGRGRSRPGWPRLKRWWRGLLGWAPWRWGWRWRRLRWRWRRWRRRRRVTDPAADLAPDQLPELPAATLVVSADELAARGHYREAVRERLRAIVRELVERGVVDYRPGWTVTELARIAGAARPPVAAPLAAASELFSGIWYGRRPAGPADDAAMRAYAAQVRSVLDPAQVST